MAKEAPYYHKEQLKKSSLIPTKINRRTWISNSLKFAIPPILAGGYARYEQAGLILLKLELNRQI